MTREQLQEKTVAELRELVVKHDIAGRSALTTKDELVAALADDSPTAEQKQAKARESGATPDPTQIPMGGMTIKGEGKANAVGLFQTAPDVKEYLTAAEARDKGFYVAPTETAETTKTKKR